MWLWRKLHRIAIPQFLASQLNFKQSYFELFQFELGFDIDLDKLANNYRELQKSVHPDRFAAASAQEKRLSVQWATFVNEAYNTLKIPLTRAIYLMELHGIEIMTNPTLEPQFLMEQIELREELEQIEGMDSLALSSLDAFRKQVIGVMQTLEENFGQLLAEDPAASEHVIYKMQFINKLKKSADQLEEKLLNY